MTTDITGQEELHLHPRARGLLSAPDSVRIAACYETHWVPHTAAVEALSRVSHLLEYPHKNRMPNLLIYGPANSGKTAVIDRFAKENPNILDDYGEVHERKSLCFGMPANPTEPRLFSQVLAAYGNQFGELPRKMTTELRALQILHQHTPRVLIVDDLQHILSSSARSQLRVLNHLKSLSTELRIPLVAVGTTDVLMTLQSDQQLASHFKAVEISRWRNGFGLAAFVSAFGMNLPLRKRSSLMDADLVGGILELSDGLTGEIISLLSQAADLAIRLKIERITLPLVHKAASGELFKI